MTVSSNRRPADFFSEEESRAVVAAIGVAERQTSGEIRVHLEAKCPGGDPYIRGRELFEDLVAFDSQSHSGILGEGGSDRQGRGKGPGS